MTGVESMCSYPWHFYLPGTYKAYSMCGERAMALHFYYERDSRIPLCRGCLRRIEASGPTATHRSATYDMYPALREIYDILASEHEL